MVMRLRDHDKADLGLAALTLTVVIASAGYEGTRRAREALSRRRLRDRAQRPAEEASR
jgi:hypothetical protein